eukprot:TRINITY_DN106062_c0_g1_i1.p1 TRINITY_DN106062_c0_g1~~TRINITY_DN106062_c0_g1_i1.p1  ORF type:complete len:180 (+),score=49.86 TRINITY_DN106062_c0_g1_i1:41-541(+)
MGGCECCASSRRKEVETMIEEAKAKGSSRELRDAIYRAEGMGYEVLDARKVYAELAKLERQSPDRSQEMLRWAFSTQDGVILLQVIQEVERICPDSTGLRPAKRRLFEFQGEAKLRLQKLSMLKDASKLAFWLDRARQMGIPAGELAFAEAALKQADQLPTSSRKD